MKQGEEPDFADLVAPFMRVALDTSFECAQGSSYALGVLIKHLHDRHLLDTAALREEFLQVAAAIDDDNQSYACDEAARLCLAIASPPEGDKPSWFRGVIQGGRDDA